jgi:biopolymer transport protein ExbB
MRLPLFICVLLCSLPCAHAETAGTLEELVKQVQQERISEKKDIVEREEKFRQSHDQQQHLLNVAQVELVVEQKRGDELKAQYEQNQLQLEQQGSALAERMGSLSRLHDIVTQLANDIDVVISSSLVSAQIPGRDLFVNRLAASREMPAIDDLEQLWRLVFGEITEAGKIVTFPARIINNSGTEVEQNVTRVGVFNAVSNGHFLYFNPDTKKLQEPARQPAGRYQSMARDLEQDKDGIIAFPVDPTRGVLLSLLIQSPDLAARIQQAGVVGYIILALGLFALGIAAERFLRLFGIRSVVMKQRNESTISLNNPLGRLRQVEIDSPRADAETLGLKLDQAIMKEIPKLRQRLPMLAVFATAAPLLGLLGTVAGMIETFQSMMLFGAGDPKIVSGGISLALVATELGLIVAIPILLLHGWLHGISNQIIHLLEEEIAVIVARREEQIHSTGMENV